MQIDARTSPMQLGIKSEGQPDPEGSALARNAELTLAEQDTTLHAWSEAFDKTVDLKSWDYPSRLRLMANLNYNPSRVGWRFRLVKRLFDMVFAASALMALAPVLATIALLIRLTSKGPILFLQPRVGFRLRTFTILKFRTMHLEMEKVVPIFDMTLMRYRRPNVTEDLRITPLGRFLRRWSLDELPQLFNILVGDMSLIGPRPLSIEEALKIPEDAFCRYAVPAGLTGLAQIKARSVVVDPSRFNWDITYLNQLGGRQELMIFLHTFAAIRDKC